MKCEACGYEDSRCECVACGHIQDAPSSCTVDSIVGPVSRQSEEYQAGYRAGYKSGRNSKPRYELLSDDERNSIAVQWLHECAAKLIKRKEEIDAQIRVVDAEIALKSSGFIFPPGYFDRPNAAGQTPAAQKETV